MIVVSKIQRRLLKDTSEYVRLATMNWEESREVKVSLTQAKEGYDLYLAHDDDELIAVSTLAKVENTGLQYINTLLPENTIKEFYQVCSFAGIHKGGGRAIMETYIELAQLSGLPLYINSVFRAIDFYIKFKPDFLKERQFIFNLCLA